MLALASMLSLSALASAQSADNSSQGVPTSGGVVGVGVASVPKYQGSEQTKIRAVPILEYHWANGIFVGGDNDTVIGFQISGSPRLQYGVALSVDEGRKERHASALAGMGNVATKATLVSFVKAAVTDHLSVNSSVHIGSGNDSKGSLLKLGAAYGIELSQSTQLSFNFGAALANASYMENYFGVNASQSLASHYRIYAPAGGLRDVNVGIRLSYQLDRDWSLLAGLSSTTLSSIGKDSPIVRKATAQKMLLGVAYILR